MGLMSGAQLGVLNFTEDTLIGNLWTYLGEPAQAVDVVMTVDGCDVGNIIIPNDFNGASTFNITCTNAGES